MFLGLVFLFFCVSPASLCAAVGMSIAGRQSGWAAAAARWLRAGRWLEQVRQRLSRPSLVAGCLSLALVLSSFLGSFRSAATTSLRRPTAPDQLF